MLDVKILPTSLQILAHVPLSPAPRTPHPIDLGILPTPNVILAHPRLIRLNRLPIHRPHLSPGLSRRETRSLRDVPKTQGRVGAATHERRCRRLRDQLISHTRERTLTPNGGGLTPKQAPVHPDSPRDSTPNSNDPLIRRPPHCPSLPTPPNRLGHRARRSSCHLIPRTSTAGGCSSARGCV